MSYGRKVAYFYDDNVPNYYYGHDHPMKPKRIGMTHSLINHYKMYSLLHVYEPAKASREDLCMFHTPEYVEYLEKVNPKTFTRGTEKKNSFKIGETTDCPIFNGVFEFSQISAGGSIGAASMINNGAHDICVNWAGGLHHAKKSEASGFCYVNDTVLGILELLKYHPRVLYIDIDVHHGDGVEEAFFLTPRVMTVSFHQYGKDFFPGTGHHDSVGADEGKYHCLNVPLYPGITDQMYINLFQEVMSEVIAKFQPDAIVLQCGADSINDDKLGQFNLSTRGHGACVEFILKFGIPLMLLGGGGYTIENVARCWAYETSLALGVQIDNKLPPNEYSHEYSGPYLHVEAHATMENKNSKEHIEKLKVSVFERLKYLEGAPGFQFHDVPGPIRYEDFFDDDGLDNEKNQIMDKMQMEIEEDREISMFNPQLLSKPADHML
jgi:histone deacetylase 1/2